MLELIGVGRDGHFGSGDESYFDPMFESHHAVHERPNLDGLEFWRRQARQPRVIGHESAQGLRSGADDREAFCHVLAPVRGQRFARHQLAEAAGN